MVTKYNLKISKPEANEIHFKQQRPLKAFLSTFSQGQAIIAQIK